MGTPFSFSQNIDGRKVDLKIYFHYDLSQIDPNYMSNRQALNLADSLLRDSLFISTLRTIEITAQSSPEGSVEHNKKLSERRRESLEQYFIASHPQIDPSLWSFKSVAENWELFHQHLVEDVNLPHREEILSISAGSREADNKEWLLKTMYDGQPWQYIKENILPSQRFGASVLFIPLFDPPAEPEPEPIPEPIAPEKQEIVVEKEEIIPTIEPITQAEPEEIVPTVLFALKTNLLLDAVTAVNLAAEIPIGNRLSVVGEVIYPWWRSWPNNFTMQIESYHAELKYWLGERTRDNRLAGWSVGAYGGWGRYDIQLFREEGVQGDFYDLGAQICYSHPIAKNLHLEYSLGLGYLSTDYNDYQMTYATDEFGDVKVIPYPWINSSLKSLFPSRVGVSLVWHITSSKKGGAE